MTTVTVTEVICDPGQGTRRDSDSVGMTDCLGVGDSELPCAAAGPVTAGQLHTRAVWPEAPSRPGGATRPQRGCRVDHHAGHGDIAARLQRKERRCFVALRTPEAATAPETA